MSASRRRSVADGAGLSGCGKTTVLRCIAGLMKLDHGMLKVGEAAGGTPTDSEAASAGREYVFQETKLFAHLTEQTFAFGMKRAGVKDARGLRDIVDLMGIADHLKRIRTFRAANAKGSPLPGPCSPNRYPVDGRTAVAWPVRRPTSSLLETLSDKLNIPIIHVTHDLAEVERLARHMVLMEKGRARRRVVGNAAPRSGSSNEPDGRSGVVLNARVLDYDNIYDLTTLDMTVHIAPVVGTWAKLANQASGQTSRLVERRRDSTVQHNSLAHQTHRTPTGPGRWFTKTWEARAGVPISWLKSPKSWDDNGLGTARRSMPRSRRRVDR